MSSLLSGAWASPFADAATAAAGVLTKANAEGGFNMHPALAGIMGAIANPGAAAKPAPVPSSPPANVRRDPPPPPPGLLARVTTWAKDNPLAAGGIALGAVLLGWLAFRK